MDRLPPPLVAQKPAVQRPAAAPPGAVQVNLRFDVQEGLNHNLFVQSPGQSSHAVVTTAERPRVLLTSPAGNSGVGLWFDPRQNPGLHVDSKLVGIEKDGTI